MNKMNTLKRICCVLVALCMLFSVLPSTVFAQETTVTDNTTDTTVPDQDDVVTDGAEEDNEGEEEEIDYSTAMDVSSAEDLSEALSLGEKLIRVIADFELDRTFFITYNTIIFSDEAHTLTRAADFGGDIFVVGEDENGTVCEDTVVFQLGRDDSITNDLLVIDGNKENMTATVTGTVIFALSNAEIKLYDNLTVQNCFKSGNEKTYNLAYELSYPARIGGPVAINAGGVINIYGGNYKNNSVNTTNVTTEIENEDGSITTDSLSIWGGAFYFFGKANIYGGVFEGNAAYRAGALYAYRTLSIYGGTIKNNTSSTYGGAIYVPASTLASLYIDGENDDGEGIVEISGNTAENGGALYLYGKPSTINNVNFIGNTSSNHGGAIYAISESSGANDIRLTISNSTFTNNTTDHNGGAVYMTGTNVYYENVTFEGNHAKAIANDSGSRYGGGALYSTGSYFDMDGATFKGNSSDHNGGAIYVISSSTAIMNNITAQDNTASSGGGFIYNSNSVSKIYNSAIKKSNSGGHGGAVYISSGATLEAIFTTFEDNTAGENGGAIFIYSGADTTNVLHSCVFVGNSSNNYGGAIYITNISVLNAYNTTAKSNSAVSGGFLYETKAGSVVTLNGLTVEGNTSTTGGPIIHGNTSNAVLYLNKTNYMDIDSTVALDTAYWKTAIQGSLDVNEITEGFPGFINYGDTEETAPEDIVNPNVTNVIELQSALAAKLKKITIISDFQIDRTFYVTADTTIYFSGTRTLLRRPYFGGDIFVIGESANGEIPEKEITVNFTAVDEESSLTIDGNKDALTTAVSGTTFFVCNGATLNLQEDITVQNCFKTENEKVLNEDYNLASAVSIGGPVAIVTRNSTLNIYGGNYLNNSVNTEADDESTSTQGGAIYNYGTINIYGGIFKNNIAYRGGAFYNCRTTNIYNALIEENSATTNGGAIYIPTSDHAFLRIGTDNNEVVGSVTFKNNTATAQGGAIYGQGALIQIEKTTFENNSVSSSGTNGGALRIDVADSETPNFIVRDSIFKNNTSQTYGGAMYIHSTNGLIENTTFESNTATTKDGGVAYLTIGSSVEFVSVRFNNNTSGAYGGAISARSSSKAIMYNVKANNNTCTLRGGAVYVNASTLNVYNSYFNNNVAASMGGAIGVDAGSVSGIYESKFINNKSTSEGGALFVYNDGNKATVQSCYFEGNSTDSNGGAIYVANKSLLDLYNITAKNNSANKGGFLYITSTDTLTVLNDVTLSGNKATSGGPIIWGNTKNCKLHINKNNYTDLDHTGAYDSAYWKAAIYNAVTVTEITDEIPSFDGYGDETYDDIDKAVKVSNSKELEEAINNGDKHIQIVSDFDIDRTFYITNDTTIFALTPYRLTRANDFAGDMFVVGEYANGDFVVTKNKTVKLTLGNPNSTTENLLIIDGNCNNMTVDVVGSVVFSCNSSTVNIYNNTTIVDNTKLGNERALNDTVYDLSKNTPTGGAAIIVESGTLNIYGGKFIRNSSLGYNGGVIYNKGNVKIYDGKFSFNKGDRGGFIYNLRICKIYGGSFESNYSAIGGGTIYTSNTETAITYIGANTGTNTVFFNSNKSRSVGGALYGGAKGTVVIYGDTEFTGNFSQKSHGGAIYACGVLLISNADFKDSSAKNGGAIYCANTNETLPVRYLKFENCTFANNTAKYGGAIHATDKANITIKDSDFIENSAESEGGAVYAAYDSTLKISDSDFTSNISASDTRGYGGAISVHSSHVNTNNVIFSQNSSSKRGGAIYISYNSVIPNDSNVVLENTVVKNNTCVGAGGAVYLASRTIEDETNYELTAKNTDFTENIAGSYGGAIYYNGSSKSYYQDVNFTKNKTTSELSGNIGGAICSSGATIKINKASFVENSSEKGGGAIYLTGSTLDANEVTFENNTALAEGGAISVRGSSTAVINNATMIGNTSGAQGGALYVTANLDMYNSTLSGNTSGTAGAAISFYTGGTGNIYKTNFINNTSPSEGGAIFACTSGKPVTIQDCNFEGNTATTNGGSIYTANQTPLNLYSNTASNNTSAKGGFLYATSSGTVVTLNGITLSSNTATTGGPIIWGNTKKATLQINKNNYTDLDHTSNYDDAYWAAAIYNLLTVNEITDEIPTYTDYVATYPKEEEQPLPQYYTVDVDAVFDLTKSSSDANINSHYNKLPKLDNSSNFMSKNTTLFENINGEDVTVDSFVSYNGDTADNGSFGEGMLILQAMQYKKAHPEEDVKISIASFRFSVQAAINVNRNSRYFGYMRNLSGGAQYDKFGFVRISYLLVCAASMGIDVTVVGQLDAYPTSVSEPKLYQYFSSALTIPCSSEYVTDGVIGDYLTFSYCDWKSYNAKANTDMMHIKMCAVSHYLDKDGIAHKNAIWTSSSNLDGINANGTNGNSHLQTSTIVSDHAEIYRVTDNYIDLVSQYCEQEDVYIFRDLANARSTEQVDLLSEGKGDQIPNDEQIVYLGTENDDVFELYFAPFGGDTLEWSEKYNPYCKYLSALNKSEDYIEFAWNNVTFSKTSLTTQFEKVIVNAFNINKNKNNKLYLNLKYFSPDKFSNLEVGKDIGYVSINNLDFGSIHSKDLQLSYVQNGERKYVSMLNSMNAHSGSMCYQANVMLVIKETECTEDSVYFTLADLTTKGIVEHNYGEAQTYLPETNEDGYRYKVCEDCGKTKILDTVHRESEWIVDKPATETKKGLEHKTCTACGILLFARESSLTSADVFDLSQNSGIAFDSNPSSLVPIDAKDIPYTFETTVQVPKSLSSRAGVILGNYGTSSNTQLNLEVYTHGKIRLFLMVGKQKTEHIFSTDIRSDSPTNVAVTIDGTKASLYVNGKFSEEATLDFAYSELLEDLKIGGDNRSGNPQYFKGEIHSVNLFSDVRTAQEVKTDAIYVSQDTDALTYSKYFTTNEERFECKMVSSVGQTFCETVAHSIDTLKASPATIEATVSIPKNHAQSAGVILGNYGDLYDSQLNIEVVEEGKLKLYVANGENISETTFSTDVRYDTAVNLAVTVDGKEARLYVNGKLTETQDFSAKIPSTLEGLKIGGDNRKGNSEYFKGTIYSVALFSDIRTTDEIASDMILVSSDSDNLLYLTRFCGSEKANADKPIGQTFSAEELLAIDELQSTPYTLEATVNVPKSMNSRAGVIIGNYDTGSSNKLNLEVTNNGKPRLYINNGTTTYTYVFNADIRSDDPVHIALTINKRVLTLYVNGEKVEDQYLSRVLPDITQNFKIGGDNREGNTQYFKGTIYNVALFGDVRTAEEIKLDAVSIDNNADNLILSKDLIKKETYSLFAPIGKTFSANYSHSLGNISGVPATLEAVVNLPTDVEDRAGTIVGNYDGGNGMQINLEAYSKGRIRLHVNNGTEKFSTFFSSDIRSDRATHIAVTIEDKLATLYINGVAKEKRTLSISSLPQATENFVIGGDNRVGNTEYFKGAIYSVSLFSDIRTPQEIKSDMFAVCSGEENLIYTGTFTNANINTSTGGAKFSEDKLLAIDELQSTPYTLEATVNVPKSMNSRAGVIIGNYSVGSSSKLNLEVTNNGKLRLYINNGTTTYTYVFNADIRSDDPVHIALTINKKVLTLYVNGEKVENQYLARVLPDITQNFKIGGDNRDGNAQYFKGTIYNVALFGDVRTEKEIKADAVAIDNNADSLLYSKCFTNDTCHLTANGEHISGEWIIDSNATTTHKGAKHIACTTCGKVLSVGIINTTSSEDILIDYSDTTGASFETNEDAISITEALSSAPTTFEATLNLPTSYSARGGVILGNYTGTLVDQINLEIYTFGKPRLYFKKNNKAYTYLFKTDIRSNKLTHLALVVDGLTANLYLDGELKETITLDTTLPDVRSGYKIGADNRTTTPQPFKGTIYAVNIFSDARTAEEILTDTLLVPSDTDNLIYSNYITKK